ncbi:MAG: 4-hydroxythreonine-4-phosphate dehydrogenase PdxA [Muribaculaceae bacterium]|nr:4-hydroxythreonine-4-phosphate dehydrogenase PdxA [Muribaculaceae bacterium]
MASDKKIRLGITQGDTNGIGYELILKTLADSVILDICTPVIYGSSKVAAYYRKMLNLEPLQLNSIDDASDIRNGYNNIVEVIKSEVKVEPGVESKEAGEAALLALRAAVADLKAGKIDAIVTAPINKNAIQTDDFNFPGHTEYLENEFASESDSKSLMILFSDKLRVALATTHIPVKDVASHISKESIVEKLTILDRSLRLDFACDGPRIAVLALNPHAGENGLLGAEEQDVIIPAINEAYDKRIYCFGPYAADGFFGTEMYKKFDAVLAMYHDQGLAPFKTIAMDSGVNFTAGLSCVRTSPDHGTAYDIVGKDVASVSSFRDAIFEACNIYRNRANYRKSHSNPLRRQYFDKSNDKETIDITKVEVDTENTL